MNSVFQSSLKSRTRLIRIIVLAGTFVALCALVVTAEVTDPSSYESDNIEAYPWHRPITSGAFTLYQQMISPGRGAACPMHPHCSMFGREAFANHNPLRAYVMTADRLLRCGHDLNQYRLTSVGGRPRYFDPITVEQAFGVRTSFAATAGESELAGDIGSATQPFVEHLAAIDISSDGLLFRFAFQLQQDGDYERAITEYLRLVSYYPKSQYYLGAKLAVVQSYHAVGSFSQAITYGESVLSEHSNATEGAQIKFLVGASRFKSGELESALSDFTDLAQGNGEYREKGIMARGLTHAHLQNWSAATQSFDAIDDASELSMKARYCARLSREATDLGYKNPKIAGLLAIVPGLGYAYDGYYSTALSAFVVNGLFMWSTYEAFRQDHNGLGVTLAMFGFGWYAGNIYGSAYSAMRQNDKMRHDHLLKFDVGFKF